MRASAEQIARELGGHRNGRTWMAKCPCHADKTASLALRDAEVGVLFFCHAGCDRGDLIDALVRRGLWDTPRHENTGGSSQPRQTPAGTDPADTADRSAFPRTLWKRTEAARGTLGETYLHRRGLTLSNASTAVLRFHARCPFGEAGSTVPALVAAFHPFHVSREMLPVAIHRIGLTPLGDKIDKRMLGPVQGAAVKLDELEGYGLGICEGIETGLAIQAHGWHPVWALGSANAIRSFPLLPGIDCLTIFADHDKTGDEAARTCAMRYSAAGIEVKIFQNPTEGADVADDLNNKRA